MAVVGVGSGSGSGASCSSFGGEVDGSVDDEVSGLLNMRGLSLIALEGEVGLVGNSSASNFFIVGLFGISTSTSAISVASVPVVSVLLIRFAIGSQQLAIWYGQNRNIIALSPNRSDTALVNKDHT